jgi:predicted nucleotidyltransferase
MADPNIERLIKAARLLKPVLDEVVFVGGSITGLFVSDPAAGAVRATFDVDVITRITSYEGYVGFSERLRKLNFEEDTSEGAPVCRWKNGDTTLDVMPLDENILGFSNRWYKDAMDGAKVIELEAGLEVQVVTAPYFCATKIEAFKGRGQGDYLSSRDLEDLITVVDSRPELVEELQSAPDAVRSYIVAAVSHLLGSSEFIDALPGYLLPDAASQSRVTVILERLREIANI